MKVKLPYWYLLIVPLLCYGLGAAMNVTALAANHQQMPVYEARCEERAVIWLSENDALHACFTPATRLRFLCDWIYVPGTGVASPGDCLVWLYENLATPAAYLWVVLMVMEYNRRKQR